MSPCCYHVVLKHFCLTQTRSSLAPLYVHLMCLKGSRFDILDVARVSVYTYSSHLVICGLFRNGHAFLRQLICHDVFRLCTISQIPPVVRLDLRLGKFPGDGALCWRHYLLFTLWFLGYKSFTSWLILELDWHSVDIYCIYMILPILLHCSLH